MPKKAKPQNVRIVNSSQNARAFYVDEKLVTVEPGEGVMVAADRAKVLAEDGFSLESSIPDEPEPGDDD